AIQPGPPSERHAGAGPPRRAPHERATLPPILIQSQWHAKGAVDHGALRRFRPRRQAACGRYCRQAVGIVGLATWMKTSGRGVRGVLRRCMPAWRGRLSPLRRLQGAQEATMFSQLDGPPFDRGMTWSTVRFERAPQYWHVQPSRAKTARRVMRRLWVSRGTGT